MSDRRGMNVDIPEGRSQKGVETPPPLSCQTNFSKENFFKLFLVFCCLVFVLRGFFHSRWGGMPLGNVPEEGVFRVRKYLDLSGFFLVHSGKLFVDCHCIEGETMWRSQKEGQNRVCSLPPPPLSS
jgi:hypothetical protein